MNTITLLAVRVAFAANTAKERSSEIRCCTRTVVSGSQTRWSVIHFHSVFNAPVLSSSNEWWHTQNKHIRTIMIMPCFDALVYRFIVPGMNVSPSQFLPQTFFPFPIADATLPPRTPPQMILFMVMDRATDCNVMRFIAVVRTLEDLGARATSMSVCNPCALYNNNKNLYIDIVPNISSLSLCLRVCAINSPEVTMDRCGFSVDFPPWFEHIQRKQHADK